MGKLVLRAFSFLFLSVCAWLQVGATILCCDSLSRGWKGLFYPVPACRNIFLEQALILNLLMILIGSAIYGCLWQNLAKYTLPERFLLRLICYISIVWGTAFTALLMANIAAGFRQDL